MTFKRDYIYILAIAVVVILLFLEKCGGKKEVKEEASGVITFLGSRDSADLLKINMQAKEIDIMKQNILSEAGAKELLKKELKGYKKLSAYLEAKLTSSLTNKDIEYNEKDSSDAELIKLLSSECIPKDTVMKYFVKTPKSYIFEDKWVYVSGKMEKTKNHIDSIGFRNELDITIGTKGEGFLGAVKKPVVETKSYSPYSTIQYVNNVIVSDKRSLSERIMLSKLAMFMYGFGTGYLTNQIRQ